MPDVDFIARLADAWDGRGSRPLTPPAEQGALLRLAYLPEQLAERPWSQLTPEQRERLVFAARRAADFGTVCARVFGL